MIGRAYLRLRQRFGHGLRVAYWRDVRRAEILRTAPCDGSVDNSCEIHVLTCAADWLNTIWTLKSLYAVTERRFALCIHEDGSLTQEQIRTLQDHFPAARVIDRPGADEVIARILAKRPKSSEFRSKNPLALKVFDFAAFLKSERMFLLDSDILFFNDPAELLRRLTDVNFTRNTLNRDWTYGYSVAMDTFERMSGGIAIPEINSGLGLIHKNSIDFDAVERWLEVSEIWSHSHRIEQTLIALSSASFGFEFLPPEYDVHLGPFSPDVPCRHFTGPIRHRMYSEGIRHLTRAGLLAATVN